MTAMAGMAAGTTRDDSDTGAETSGTELDRGRPGLRGRRGQERGVGQARERARLRLPVRAWMRAPVRGLRGLCARRALRRDSGMVTSEYAVGIIAAVGLAAVLYKVLTSGQVAGELQDIVKRALSVRM